MKKALTLFLFILLAQSAGFIGSFFTVSAIPDWYELLNKPSFFPPNWIFGPIWITLYLLMGISAFFIFEKGWKKKKVKNAIILFGIQLACNALWSILFFGLRSPLLAFFDILVLLLFIMVTLRAFYPLSKFAAYLLIPYLLWVSFATVLNGTIVLLNAY